MPKQFKSGNGQLIQLEDLPLGTGGEGDVHRFFNPNTQQRHLVVKLYHDTQNASRRKNKIEFMIQNQPQDFQKQKTGEACIIWPCELVYTTTNEFIGYVMPLVNGGKDLEILCTDDLLDQIHGVAWKRFNFSESGSFLLRLRLAQNIAAALHSLHCTGKYVLVDLKPANIKIKPNGLMSLIDLDSVQIVNNSAKLFPALVNTEEYSPPECHRQDVDFEKDLVMDSWDHFSYSVLIYRLLFALHPFAGSYKNAIIQTQADAIKHGCFANGRGASSFHVIPKPHKTFTQLPKEIQTLFIKCFDDGHLLPTMRPDMPTWYKGFEVAIQSGIALYKINVAANLPKRTQTIFTPTGAGGFHAPRQPRPQTARRPVAVNHFTYTSSDITLQTLNSTTVIGQQVTLSWNVININKVFISNVGFVSPRGFATISIFKDTTFVLTATDYNNQKVVKTVTITSPKHYLSCHIKLITGKVRLITTPVTLLSHSTLVRCAPKLKKAPSLKNDIVPLVTGRISLITNRVRLKSRTER
jgi:serine/threonine protein kinase